MKRLDVCDVCIVMVFVFCVGVTGFAGAATDGAGTTEPATNSAEPAANMAYFKIGAGKYDVNGTIKQDAAPYIKDNRVYLPFRFVAYSLGIGDNSIDWEQETQTAYLAKNGEILKITIGSKEIKLGDKTIYSDAPAEISNGRTMLPIRAISEAFGCKVDWLPEQNVATVISN